jgi:AraC-like DNA-binding protein
LSQRRPSALHWQRFDIRRIEDLCNAVLGAGLEAVQMAGPPARGSLAFAARDGVIFSTGLIKGRVSVRGPVCQEAVTFGIGLRFGPGSRLWLNPATDGEVGVLLPGAPCDALLTDGSLYIAANLSEERLEGEAARAGLAIDRRSISRTGLHPKRIPPRALARLRNVVERLHRGEGGGDERVGRAILRTVIEHYSRLPIKALTRIDPAGRGSLVYRAQEFIRANLDGPILLDDLATAAGASRRTVTRAFVEILGDTPADYIRRLRLHRIRRDLIHDAVSGRAIREVAAAWGMGEPGRMAGQYCDLFGEYPHDTVRTHLMRQRMGV